MAHQKALADGTVQLRMRVGAMRSNDWAAQDRLRQLLGR